MTSIVVPDFGDATKEIAEQTQKISEIVMAALDFAFIKLTEGEGNNNVIHLAAVGCAFYSVVRTIQDSLPVDDSRKEDVIDAFFSSFISNDEKFRIFLRQWAAMVERPEGPLN